MHSPGIQVFEISDTDSVYETPSESHPTESDCVFDLTSDKQKDMLDDDTYAFFVEAGLEDPDELAMLGINLDEIKQQRQIEERLETQNKRDFELAAQLQQQLQAEGRTNMAQAMTQTTLPTAFHWTPPIKREEMEQEEAAKRLRTEKGKQAIEINDEVCIDLTNDDDIYQIQTISDDEEDITPPMTDYEQLRFLMGNNTLNPFAPSSSSTTFPPPPASSYAVPYYPYFVHNVNGKRRMVFPTPIVSRAPQSKGTQRPLQPHPGAPYTPTTYTRPLSQQETERELASLLENVVDDDPPPPEDRAGTPDGLNINLLEHQKVGLQWMMKMENSNNKGGLLADDMGLGKTIQAMAVIVQNPCRDVTEFDPDYLINPPQTIVDDVIRVKTTLIVCPVSLMDQWRREIQEKTTPPLRVMVYHGAGRTNNPYEFSQYDVVISSYSVTANNFHDTQKGPMSKVRFHRVILDEAHTIKNKQTFGARGCCQIEATYRWCLTATPIQNKIEELYSLIKFLRIRPFCDWEEFRESIVKPMKAGNHRKAIRVAHLLMKAISMRRSKKAKIDGRPILDLPERNVHMTHIDFSPDERTHYDFVEQRAQARFNKYLQAGSVMKNYSSVLVLLLRLRQACLHPNLTFVEGDGEVPAGESANPEKQEQLARQMKPDVVRRLLSDATSIAEIECPICLDIAQDAQIAKECGHILCKECLDNFINTNDGATKRCPHCRGDISKANMVPLEAFLKVHAPDLIKEAEAAEQQEKDEEAASKDKEEKEALARVHEFISSAKIDKMIEILKETNATTNNQDKTIVFSQFTAFLDLIETPLKHEGFKYLRYDGSMDIKSRADTVSKFFEDPEYTVLLVSTKCGSLGLNLTCANRVILMDIWWNPALENQAIDRVHRIGQRKPVDVHRIFINRTVEDRILELQKKKQSIADGVLGEGSHKSTSRLGLQEMIYLFRGGDVPEPNAPNPPVF
ncbi:putative ATP-dependent helicase C23E6.02 [Choanephora cucurbitarum]|uniref:Putative ATP-dependent helicase C23E6.02 n=1 Tax=Choanephora cucurbitarum TaxID=101091 RepID=A0A1C7MZS3_9FUNG|nr:putative ATP-dependent helicase C23E6.02 [Choanephora cucurbitarum]